MAEEPLPLAGLRVIDVGTRISAPFCAGLLGEMGAEVIKVEDPRGGDFMRTIGPFVTEASSRRRRVARHPTRVRASPAATRCGGRSRGGVARVSRSTCAAPRARTCSAAWRRTPTWSARTSGPAPWKPGTSAPTTATRGSSGRGSACSARTARTPGRPGLDRMGIAYGGPAQPDRVSRPAAGPTRASPSRTTSPASSPPRR